MRARWKDYATTRFHLILSTKLEHLADCLVEEVTTEFGAITEAYSSDRLHNNRILLVKIIPNFLQIVYIVNDLQL